MSQDKYLTCKDCGNEFVFTVAEQEFYAEKGFMNEPGRCPACRKLRKQQRNGSSRGYSRDDRPRYTAICASCGQETTLPFEPTSGRPVYCKECFQRRSY